MYLSNYWLSKSCICILPCGKSVQTFEGQVYGGEMCTCMDVDCVYRSKYLSSFFERVISKLNCIAEYDSFRLPTPNLAVRFLDASS